MKSLRVMPHSSAVLLISESSFSVTLVTTAFSRLAEGFFRPDS